jgi:hypothetical protein
VSEPTWADVEAKRTPVVARVRVCLRNDLVDRLAQLDVELRRAREEDEKHNRKPAAPGIAEEIQRVEAEAREHEVEFVFTEIGRRAWSDLLAQYPPDDEQRAQGLDHDPATFPPAAMAASCTSPAGTTLERMTKVFDDWGVGQVTALWRACLAANVGVTQVPKSLAASAVLRASSASSTTADPEGSPEASS